MIGYERNRIKFLLRMFIVIDLFYNTGKANDASVTWTIVKSRFVMISTRWPIKG